MSKKFYKRTKIQNWSPNYYHISQFCTMRAIFTLDEIKDTFPADYKLYKSLLEEKFYFQAKINFLKYKIANTLSQIVKLIIKKQLKKLNFKIEGEIDFPIILFSTDGLIDSICYSSFE